MKVGQKAVMVKTITAADVEQYAVLTGDGNRLHTDDAFAGEPFWRADRPVDALGQRDLCVHRQLPPRPWNDLSLPGSSVPQAREGRGYVDCPNRRDGTTARKAPIPSSDDPSQSARGAGHRGFGRGHSAKRGSGERDARGAGRSCGLLPAQYQLRCVTKRWGMPNTESQRAGKHLTEVIPVVERRDYGLGLGE